MIVTLSSAIVEEILRVLKNSKNLKTFIVDDRELERRARSVALWITFEIVQIRIRATEQETSSRLTVLRFGRVVSVFNALLSGNDRKLEGCARSVTLQNTPEIIRIGLEVAEREASSSRTVLRFRWVVRVPVALLGEDCRELERRARPVTLQNTFEVVQI